MKDQSDNVTIDMFGTNNYYLVTLSVGVEGYIKVISHTIKATDKSEAIELALALECHNSNAYIEGVQPIIDDIFEYRVQSVDEITHQEYNLFKMYGI